MTRDDITRMAREAGFVGFDGDTKCLREFANLVIAAEREACAEICDNEMDNAIGLGMKISAGNCSDKIRERV